MKVISLLFRVAFSNNTLPPFRCKRFSTVSVFCPEVRTGTIDEQAYRNFARGLEEVFVIEDKREQIEHGMRKACYLLPEAERPRRVDMSRYPEAETRIAGNYFCGCDQARHGLT